MRTHDITSGGSEAQPSATPSRRTFLWSAAAAGIASIPAVAHAQDPRIVLDAAALNFLLRFEYIQAALYRDASTRFLDRDFAPLGAGVFSTLLSFRDQEDAHVATLQSLITRLGATPLPDCGDRFARFANVQQFLQIAFTLENIGVSAYLGVLPMLRSPQLQSDIAAISSVESRHSAFIGLLNGESPAPAPADTPRSREEILRLLAPYARPCSAS